MRAITQLHPNVPDWVSRDAAVFILTALDKSAVSRAPILRLLQLPWILSHTRTSTAGWVEDKFVHQCMPSPITFALPLAHKVYAILQME